MTPELNRILDCNLFPPLHYPLGEQPAAQQMLEPYGFSRPPWAFPAGKVRSSTFRWLRVATSHAEAARGQLKLELQAAVAEKITRNLHSVPDYSVAVAWKSALSLISVWVACGKCVGW